MAIEIKPSHKGLLHKALGMAQDKKIPMNRLKGALSKARKSGDTKLEKEVVFAKNAKKWHH